MKEQKPINPDALPDLIEDENSFARFDELARKLLRVPKSELDEKQAEYEAQPKTGRDERHKKMLPPQ